MPRRRDQAGSPVVSVTDAQPGRSEDLDSRIARYAWMMSLRIVCFVLAVLTPSPWRWMFVVGAVFLPSVAVVLANTHQSRRSAGVTAYDAPPHPQLTRRPGPVVPADPGPEGRPENDTKS